MNLTLFFRLIGASIFHGGVVAGKSTRSGDSMDYNNTFFYCPVVYAKDGWSVSLQIHYGSYCTSENGYRRLGHTWEEVEVGFPSEDEDIFLEFGFDGAVGSVPVSVLEEVFERRGGIDWDRTISVKMFNEAVGCK